MKLLTSLAASIITLVSLPGFTQAAQPSDDLHRDSAVAETSCRRIITAQDEQGTIYCGTAEQWDELDRRIALINDGVTCRWVNMPGERCMNAEQWRRHDRRVRDYSDAARMGQNARASAAMMVGGSPADMEATTNAIQLRGD